MIFVFYFIILPTSRLYADYTMKTNNKYGSVELVEYHLVSRPVFAVWRFNHNRSY